VRAVTWLKLLSVAVVLCGSVATAALAQNSEPLTSDPQPVPEHPLPGTAAPSGAASDVQSCLQETGDYVTRGSAVIYAIGLANTCEKRLRCEIFANVTGARGTSLGHTVMDLGPGSSGSAAKKSYEMRVKAAGGVAQVSRQCRTL
jgi:hypothetical protein